jgi:hypothetical protein
MVQSEIVEISGSPQSVFDGPCGLVVKDATAGRLYIKKSPAGSKTGWKRLIDEDEVVLGGGGSGGLIGTGAPTLDLGASGGTYFDETPGSERLYAKKSDGTWFLFAGAALLFLLLSIVGARAADPLGPGGTPLLPRSAVEATAYGPSWNSNTNLANKDVLFDIINTLAPLASPTFTGSPVIPSFSSAQHNHQNASGGGTLDGAAIASGTIAKARGGTGADNSSVTFPASGTITVSTDWNTVTKLETATGVNLITATEIDDPAELEAIMGGINLITGTEINSVAKLEALTGVNLITSTEIDTIGELEALLGGVDVLLATELDTSAKLAAKLSDETGTGPAVFANSPTINSTKYTPVNHGSVTTFRIDPNYAEQYGTATGNFVFLLDTNSVTAGVPSEEIRVQVYDAAGSKLASLSSSGTGGSAFTGGEKAFGWGTNSATAGTNTYFFFWDGAIWHFNQDTAQISAGQLATGAVSDLEFGYLDGVTSAIQTQIDAKQASDSDLTAVAGLSGTGLIARTGSGTATTRTITAGTGVSMSNGDGVSGNPTVSIGQAVATSDSPSFAAVALGTTPAAAGVLRLPNASYWTARNAANGADLNGWRANSSDYLDFGTSIFRDDNGLYTDRKAWLSLFRQFTSPSTSGNRNAVASLQFQTKQSGNVNAGTVGLKIEGGDRSDVVNKTVSGAANNGSGLIRITTSTSHGFSTGDKITVYGVGGTTEANGVWTITSIDSTHFDLQSSTFSNVYTSGGTASNRGLYYGISVAVVPTLDRGGFTGTAANGDDIAAYVAYNSGTGKATDAYYLGRNASIVGSEWITAFTSDANSDFGVRINGTVVNNAFDSSSATITAGVGMRLGDTHAIQFGTTTPPFLVRDAAYTLGLRNGANANALYVYNTYTDASNYERLGLSWSGNVARLQAENAGTGVLRSMIVNAVQHFIQVSGTTVWNITSSGHLVPGADNQRDIGSSSAGVRQLYAVTERVGLSATPAVAGTIASAGTIAPTAKITFISGTAAIATITAPAPISSTGGQITLIPTGIFTTTTAGNIALATTAVVSKALIMTYDATTTKWYPSY